MALSVDTVVLFIHITSVIFWLAAIPIIQVLKSILDKIESQSNMILSSLKPVSIMIMTSQALVFLTGGYLTEDRWFNFSNYGWLALKQLIFFLLIGFSHMFIIKNMRNISKSIEDNGEDEQIKSSFDQIAKLSYVSGLLILINLFLASVKPF